MYDIDPHEYEPPLGPRGLARFRTLRDRWWLVAFALALAAFAHSLWSLGAGLDQVTVTLLAEEGTTLAVDGAPVAPAGPVIDGMVTFAVRVPEGAVELSLVDPDGNLHSATVTVRRGGNVHSFVDGVFR
ncbi:MAG: hypothetical protein HQK87_07290 [Nitrospinae bacterium]|nr:hypothetical protein [Nitrospinota bacterium]